MDSRKNAMKKSRRFGRALMPPALLLLGLLAVGCQTDKGLGGSGLDSRRQPLASVASRLGLRVERSDDMMATLRNNGNTVLVFAGAKGSVYVNGRKAADGLEITAEGGRLLVPNDLEARLRPLLASTSHYVPSRGNPGTGANPLPPVLVAGRKLGTVVLDPGHGGRQPGAMYAPRGSAKIEEKGINLQIARLVEARLQQCGVVVVMTRNSDLEVELEERAAVANRIKADLFVSNHANASTRSSVSGFEVYVSERSSAASQRAAALIANRLEGAGISPQGSYPIQKKDLRVLTTTSGPAVLVEVGYMSNASELALLTSASHQKKIAEGIALGIVDFLQKK